jgi:hypothetical protein
LAAVALITLVAGMRYAIPLISGGELVSAAWWLLPGLLFAITVAFGIQLRRYLARAPRVMNAHGLIELKRVVKSQMIASVVASAMLILWTVILGVEFERTLESPENTLFTILVAAVFTVIAVWLVRLHRRCKELPMENEAVRLEFERIWQVWHTKMFPNW